MRKITIWLLLGILVLGIMYMFFAVRSHAATITLKTIDPALLHELIDKLSKKFDANIQIQSITQLTEPDRRNLVLRITIKNPAKGMPGTVILKQSLSEESAEDDKKAFGRFARDWAGLEFVSSLKTEAPLAPAFYGGSTQYRFILLEDLGEKHASLSDPLASGNTVSATAALEQFMRCLGKLHAYSYSNINKYLEILNSINPDAESYQADIKNILANTLPKLESVLKQIKVPYTTSLQEEITRVVNAVIASGPFVTFIHGDCCPGNTFYNDKKNELVLIDFEWGYVRNALLDGTYLRMRMPNCWSPGAIGTIPEKLIEALESDYRQELMKKIPAAKDDAAYLTAYVHACAYWLLKAVLVIQYVLDKDEPVRARILYELQAFMEVAEKYGKLPQLAAMSKQILKELKDRWPETKPMDMYPAFR